MNVVNSIKNQLSGLSAFYAHPDIKFINGRGYIDDLRERYLPAESYGSTYFPLGKPVIATMPGLDKASPNCYDFFVRKEIYLIDSKRFCYRIAVAVAFFAVSFFVTLIAPTIVVNLVAQLALYALWGIANELVQRHFDGKVDDIVLETATNEEKSAVLGFIEALQDKGKTVPINRPFEGLRRKLVALKTIPTPFDPAGFAEHDAHRSSIGLPYTMRPNKNQLGTDEISELFYKREAFHASIEQSDLVKIAGGIGIIAVTATVMPGVLASRAITLPLFGAALYVYYKAAHYIGDFIFQKKEDPACLLKQPVHLYSNIYRGAY